MSVRTIRDGGLVVKDPADASVYEFDWDEENLADGVTITSSTFAVVGLHGDVTTTPMTADSASVLTGDRKTQVRLTAGALGSKWRIDNRIITDEAPSQTKERSFFVKVDEL
jgi:uncharacterized membrane protein